MPHKWTVKAVGTVSKRLPRSTDVHAQRFGALGREQMLGPIRAWFLWPKAEDIRIKWDTYAPCITRTTLLSSQPVWRRLRAAHS